jgi:peroxiredoxin Q/BCP
MAPALSVGDRAPLVALRDADGVERRSDQLAGQALVLFFYPKDDTPGCTMEVCAFRDQYGAFSDLGQPFGLLSRRAAQDQGAGGAKPRRQQGRCG